jgi:hypothetical protein
MKKFFIILGCITLILIAIAAASVSYIAFSGRQLDASSKAFVDTNMPSFFSTLSKDELLKISTVQVRQSMSSDQVNQLFTKLKQLGQFQKYEGSKGEANIELNYKNGTMIRTADYLASATFQNGPVQMDVKLVQNGGQWQMSDFAIYSPIFTK